MKTGKNKLFVYCISGKVIWSLNGAACPPGNQSYIQLNEIVAAFLRDPRVRRHKGDEEFINIRTKQNEGNVLRLRNTNTLFTPVPVAKWI